MLENINLQVEWAIRIRTYIILSMLLIIGCIAAIAPAFAASASHGSYSVGYPGSANGMTIGVTLSSVDSPMLIAFRIYDTSNNLLRVLYLEAPGDGSYTAYWDGKDSRGNYVPAGMVYINLYNWVYLPRMPDYSYWENWMSWGGYVSNPYPLTTIDTTGPSTNATLSGTLSGNGWYRSNVRITLISNDELGGSGIKSVQYRVDSGANQTVNGSLVMTAVGNGAHTFYYWGTDNAGNNESEHSMAINVDTQAPVTYMTHNGLPGSTDWFTSPLTLSAIDNESGIAYVHYSLDSGTFQDVAGSAAMVDIPSAGAHTLSYWSTDNVGNVESQKASTFNVEFEAPVSTISPPTGSNGWYTGPLTLSATDSGGSGMATVDYQIDSGPPVSIAGNNTSVSVPDGAHTLYYWSTDNAGNVEFHHSVSINVDTLAPVSSVSPPTGSNGWYTGPLTLSAAEASSGVASIYYIVDSGVTRTVNSASATVAIPDGTRTFEYWSEDGAGNIETHRTLLVNVDTALPSVTWAANRSPNANGWYDHDVLVTFRPNAGVSGVASMDPGYSLVLAAFSGPITCTVTSGAGVKVSVTTDTIRIDKAPPAISCDLSGHKVSQGWFDSDVRAILTSTDPLSGVNGTEYSLDGIHWNAYTGPFNIALGDQVWLYYRSTDNAGNTGTGSTVVYFPPGNVDQRGQVRSGISTATPVPTPAPGTLAPTAPPGTVISPTSSPSATPLPSVAASPASESGTNIWLILAIFAILVAGAGAGYYLFLRK